MKRPEKVAAARKTAADGIVLLENKGVLPLAEGAEVVLMGVTGYACHRMGIGSGDMLAQATVQYDRALIDAGIRVFPPVADFYRNHILSKKEQFTNVNRNWWKWTTRFHEPEYNAAFDELVKGKRKTPCIVVIGRNCGESIDLTDCPDSFRLHYEETKLLETACANFDDVIVLLNVCGVLDISALERFPVKAVAVTSLLGETSGHAVADVLTGAVNPAGRLTTTWAKRYSDYPTTDCFASMHVPYREGIYVGYRYFDTFGIEPRYPFGYGLSYTTFSVKAAAPVVKGAKATVKATVRNTGRRAGAQVVQCYLSEPDGKLEKAYQQLCAFAKTPVLEPGESADVELTFDLREFAAYCEKCACYVLEPGDYFVRVGVHSRDTHIVGALRLPKLVKTMQTVNRCVAPAADLAGLRLISKAGATPYTYAAEAKEKAAAPVTELSAAAFKTFTPGAPVAARPLKKKRGGKTVTLADVLAGKATTSDVVAQFNDRELANCVSGVIFADLKAAGETTGVGGVDGIVRGEASEFWHSTKYGIPASACADGPSGIRLTIFGDEPEKDTETACAMVAYPCGTALAQGWDADAAENFGRCVESDMELAGIDGWLAPGLNIHRNPLCGRNFEYFSEDPLVSGRMAAAISRGVQTRADGRPTGRYVTIKHFVTNNQEFFRGDEENTVSERALREIYLRGFERAVKEGAPRALMTSYNRFNGDYCATTADLLDGILRAEWGFEGLVMTDWWNGADNKRHQSSGNDVIMPGVVSKRDTVEHGLADGSVDRAAVQRSAVRVLDAIVHAMKYE